MHRISQSFRRARFGRSKTPARRGTLRSRAHRSAADRGYDTARRDDNRLPMKSGFRGVDAAPVVRDL